MHTVTFIVAAVFIIVAAILFGSGLVRLYWGNKKDSRNLVSSGFLVGILGVITATITYGFFNL